MTRIPDEREVIDLLVRDYEARHSVKIGHAIQARKVADDFSRAAIQVQVDIDRALSIIHTAEQDNLITPEEAASRRSTVKALLLKIVDEIV